MLIDIIGGSSDTEFKTVGITNFFNVFRCWEEEINASASHIEPKFGQV